MLSVTLRVLIIVAVAVGAGYVRARNLPWVPNREALEEKKETHAWLRENRGVTLEQLYEKVNMGGVVIDARPAELFAEGHLGIQCDPPVLNVPPDEIDAHIDRLLELQQYTATVVLYCTSLDCDFAEDLWVAMQDLGFFDVWIYFPGWDGMVKAGVPVATGVDTWQGYGDVMDGGMDMDGMDPNTPDEPNAAEEVEAADDIDEAAMSSGDEPATDEPAEDPNAAETP